jgi:3D (Asp-Asp-Asp) domain-containing protein
MFALVKTLSVGLCLLSVFSCIFMQPKDYLTAELSVAGDSSVTEITHVTEIARPTYKMTVVATAYCACESCCGKSDGITASGVKARANHTIAVDRNVFPLGTHILYNGIEYVAEDTGGAIKGNRIDIYFDNHSDALEWGRRTIEIEVIA